MAWKASAERSNRPAESLHLIYPEIQQLQKLQCLFERSKINDTAHRAQHCATIGTICSSDRLPVLIYGLDLAIYTILSTAGLIIEGVLFRRPCDSLIIIAVYFLNQTIGGGFHASSHLSCFLTMAVGLAFGLDICTIGWPMCFTIGVNALSILMLFSHPLVLHPNKQYLLRKTKSYKTIHDVSFSIESIASIFIFISFPQTSFPSPQDCFSLRYPAYLENMHLPPETINSHRARY